MATVNEDPQQYADTVLALLKEYTQKYERLYQEVKELARMRLNVRELTTDKPTIDVRRHQLMRQQSAIHEITRVASQLAEQGAIRDSTRLELRLRLAELEGYVDSVWHIIHMMP